MKFRNKFVLVNKIFFPSLWENHYFGTHMSGCSDIYGISHECASIKNNLGDYLGNVIVPYLLSTKNILGGTHEHLMTVGSILHAGFFDTTVW